MAKHVSTLSIFDWRFSLIIQVNDRKTYLPSQGMSLNKERAVVSKRGVDDGNQKRWGLSPARLKEPLQL